MGSRPLGGGIAIFWCSREGMFRGQTVIYRDDNTFSSIRQAAAHRVLSTKVANLPASSMKKHQYWEGRTPSRSVYPDGNFSCRTRNHPVFDIGNWLTLRLSSLHGFEHSTRSVYGQVRFVVKAHVIHLL